MKKTKKAAALLTCLTTALTTTAATSYAKDDRYFVSHFDTFDGYVQSNAYPDGFKAFVTGVTRLPDGVVESGTQAMMLHAGAKPMYAFDGIAQEGIMHVSFDMKLADANSTSGVGIMATTDYTNSKHPESFWRSAAQVRPSMFMRVNPKNIEYSTEGNAFLGSFGYTSTTGFAAASEWHKYDLIIDFDKNLYTPYIDGEKIKLVTKEVNEDGDEVIIDNGYYENIAFSRSIKNIYFDAAADAYIDNFAVENYKWTVDTFNAPVMKAEYADGNINVGFSEYMNTTAAPANFTVTNIETGAEYTPSAVTKLENTGFTLTFDNTLPSAAYIVTQTGLTGGLSGKAVVNDADFAIVDSMLENEKPYAILNETFSNYTGGMPEGWISYGDNYTASGTNAKDCLKVDWTAPGGRGFKMMSGYQAASVYKLFDNDARIRGEKFSVEFDVNSGSANWAVGLVREGDMVDYDGNIVRSTMDQAKKATYNDGMVTSSTYELALKSRERNFIVGSIKPGEMVMPSNIYGLKLYETDTQKVADIPTTGWSNVKLDFDVNAGKVTVYVDGANKGAYNFPMDTFAHVAHYDTQTKSYTYYYGIEGLRLYFKGQSAPANMVSFANVKVSNGHSYAASMDFENRGLSDTGWVPYQYRDRPRLIYGGCVFGQYYTTQAFVMKTAEGVNGGGALSFLPSTTTSDGSRNMFYLPLDKPIRKGYGFAVEFDAKGTAGMNNWEVRAGGTKDSLDNRPIGRLVNGTVKLGKYGQYDYADTNITINPDKWYHYKWIVSTTTRVTVEVTDENGMKQTAYKGWGGTALTNVLNNYDIGNIYFVLNSTDTTQSLTIDNFKAWQAAVGDNAAQENIVTESYMKAVTAKGYDGTDSFISNATNEISANTKALEIEFTGELANADAISLTSNGTQIGNKSVNANKCVISFDGVALKAGSELILSIPAGLTVGGSVTEDAHTYSFTVANDAGIKITSINLYEEVSVNDFDIANGINVSSANILAMDASSAAKPKLIIKGYNSGEETKILAATGDYSILSGTNKLINVGADTGIKTVAAGSEFTVILDAAEMFSGTGNHVKGFVWEYPTMKPLIENYSIEK